MPLADGIRRMNQQSEDNDDGVIELNVGGVHYMTTVDTLCRDHGSMLAAMFRPDSGIGLKRDRKGRVFIDRDGERFRDVINFLRNRTAFVSRSLETSRAAQELMEEADFYGLRDLWEYASNEAQRIQTEDEKRRVKSARRSEERRKYYARRYTPNRSTPRARYVASRISAASVASLSPRLCLSPTRSEGDPAAPERPSLDSVLFRSFHEESP